MQAMKMKATLEIEFEAKNGEDKEVLDASLTRGVADLMKSIEWVGIPRGVKPGSIKIKLHRELSP
jgi:hypothetical protein